MPESVSAVQLKTFMEQVPITQKTIIIIPLYGYFKDTPTEQLNYETLVKFMEGFRFKDRYVQYVFIGESSRLTEDVLNAVVVKFANGATKFLDMPPFSVYADYLQHGLEYSLEDTSNEFIVFANPWVALGWSTLDDLVARLNATDYAMICGWDKKEDNMKPEDFLTGNITSPVERVGISRDLFGINRTIGGMISFDDGYKTPYFVVADLWGQIHSMGQESLRSGMLPYYSFDVDWSLIEPEDNFNEDLKYFEAKWKFIPGGIFYKSDKS